MDSLAKESSSPESSSARASNDLAHSVPKDWKFWCIIFSLALSILLTAIEFVSRPFSVVTPPPGGVVECNIQFYQLVDFHRCGVADDHP
jgi:hypothetical protein